MNVPFDYSIDESFNTDYDKAPYEKYSWTYWKMEKAD
jgi:carboxyl-terminal processing protease